MARDTGRSRRGTVISRRDEILRTMTFVARHHVETDVSGHAVYVSDYLPRARREEVP
jgi:hypothetical protein